MECTQQLGRVGNQKAAMAEKNVRTKEKLEKIENLKKNVHVEKERKVKNVRAEKEKNKF